MARSDLEVPAEPHLAHRATREDPVAPDPAPVGRAATDRKVRHPVDQVDPVDRAVTDQKVRAILAARADRADQVDQGRTDPVGPAARAVPPHGMGIPSAATSTKRPGATDPHRGVPVSRPGRHGTGRFHRPVERGTMARSTTGATTKIRSGIPSSTSGAFGSSESGFRCNE